ncbi:MAG: PEP-CTERM sorting domain-containing protein [Phycisphaerae bacterium]|jgi:hypothetical protein|nr:PEP-CTERM sorting domain-containing protein [Phycisphaerae bacterium]
MRSQKLACICFLAVFFVVSTSRATAADVTATLRVDAWIDASAELSVAPNSTGTGTDIIWSKGNNCGAPGYCGGKEYDTGLFSSLGESASWTAYYPGKGYTPWNAAVSAPCTELTLASNFYDPTGQYNNIVTRAWADQPRDGTSLAILQQPSPGNGFSLRARFSDGYSGPSWLHARFTYPAKTELDYEWITGAGSFGDWENWSSHRVPGASHVAVFKRRGSYDFNWYSVHIESRTLGGIRVHDSGVSLSGVVSVTDSIEVQPGGGLELLNLTVAPSTVSVRAGGSLALNGSTLTVDELDVGGSGTLHLERGLLSVSSEASMQGARLRLSPGALKFSSDSRWSGVIGELNIDLPGYLQGIRHAPGDTVSVINFGANVQRSGVTSRRINVWGDIDGGGHWETRSLFTNGYIKAVGNPGPQNDSDTITANKLQGALLGGVQADSGVQVEFSEVTLDGELSVKQSWVTPGQYDGLPFSSIDFFPGGTVLQLWELGFDGVFNGMADVMLNFHEEFLPPGFDMQDLSVYHYTDGEWINLGGIVDEMNGTIQIQTDGFSPFALGTEVPEPTTLILLAAGLPLMLKRKREPRLTS